ncbi:hypothetical protein R535_25095 [Salmonella enterica subsp. enterica serovar Holcomb]|nr:hypothetical protein R535_25095 [Salmonella enterica subsp. enterica serovar Holcomb]
MLNFCSCQTARCFNKSKGVLITGLKLKAFRNPQPSWGFSIDKKRAYLNDKRAAVQALSGQTMPVVTVNVRVCCGSS